MARKKSEQAEAVVKEEHIIEKPIDQVLPDSMMPYSEYILLQRAIPRIEDGLKPVQRRILYTMHNLGLKPEGDYKKSARVVGDCLGKYHPHGDTSVYDAMVRMAQDFNMRQTLVDGQGNFGSVGGDSAAAMRYTEVKMAPLALELLRDLEKNTVNYQKNFDDSLDEPVTLPGRFPNILVNGAKGIAIGLATNIPTHNLGEVIDGCVAMLDNPAITLPEMLKIIKGPDFPSGAFMLRDGIESMYETGSGKVLLRAKTEIENADNNRQNIVITELPFGVNPEVLIKKIYELRDGIWENKKDGKKELKKDSKKEELANIIDVVDESDRTGMRLVIKLKKGEDAVKVLNFLFKSTDMQCNFGVNMVVIADGKPKQLGLLPILKYYLKYQKQVILRRSKFDYDVAKKRAHILEGLLKIMPAIDEVIAIIRSSATRTEAKSRLREAFELSEAQAEAVLCLQLGNINKLDVGKSQKELDGLLKELERLTKIINNPKEQDKVIKTEMLEIRDKYKVKRLTTIVDKLEDIDVKPFDPTKRVSKRSVLVSGANGEIKMISTRNFLSATRDAESCGEDAFATATAQIESNQSAFIFGSLGNCYRYDSNLFTEKRWEDKGDTLSSIYAGAPENERVVSIIPFDFENVPSGEIFIYSKHGLVKCITIESCVVAKPFYTVMSLKDGDEVLSAEIRESNSGIMFVSASGMCAHTATDDYPVQGRTAGGVAGMALDEGDEVVYAGQTDVEGEYDENQNVVYVPMGEIAVVTSKGFAKRVVAREFGMLKRNRKGVKIAELAEGVKILFASKVLDAFDVVIIDEHDEITVVNSEDIKLDSRVGRGKPVVFGKKIRKVLKHIGEI